MKSPVLRAVARILAFSLILPFCAPAQTAPVGAIRGVVVNDATGNFVEGAVLTLAGTNRSAVTDSQGRFHFGSLPAGDYRVRAESAGSAAGEVLVPVGAGVTATTSVRLGSEIVAMAKLMVTAQAEGQSQALNVQKNAENILVIRGDPDLTSKYIGNFGWHLRHSEAYQGREG